MDNILSVKNLSKQFQSFKLNDINFELPKGCIMGVVGENGAGKTTLIKLILELLKKDSGETFFFSGKNFKDVSENIGVVFDDVYFPQTLTVKQIGKILGSTYSTWNQRKFEEMLKYFSLPENVFFYNFSKGMKLRLGIAIAFSHDTRLLIFDEATSGIDPVARDEISDILREYISDGEKSVLISSHILSDLEKICDYIMFIHKGNMVFCMPKDDIIYGYQIVKCTKEQFKSVDNNAVIGSRTSEFGVEFLAKSDLKISGAICERPTIEDIMVYYVKGEQK